MTQHILETDTLADKTAMRGLGMVIAGLLVFTVVLAIGVAIAMG